MGTGVLVVELGLHPWTTRSTVTTIPTGNLSRFYRETSRQQANKQSHKQANEQISKHTNEQADKLAITQTSKQTSSTKKKLVRVTRIQAVETQAHPVPRTCASVSRRHSPTVRRCCALSAVTILSTSSSVSASSSCSTESCNAACNTSTSELRLLNCCSEAMGRRGAGPAIPDPLLSASMAPHPACDADADAG